MGATYDVHLGLIGKRVVDLLLVLIELFSLGVTAEALRAKIEKNQQFRPNAVSLTQFQVEKGIASTNHFCTDGYANEYLTTLSLTFFT